MSRAPSVRAVLPDDCELVWRINNEPTARSASIGREPIPLERHREWFAARLADPLCLLLIGLEAGRPVGVLRFDVRPKDASAVASIALEPGARGRGLGRALIAAGTREVLRRDDVRSVVAYTRPENVASRRAFEAVGYRLSGEDVQEGVELLRLVFTPPDAEPGRIGALLLRCDGSATIGWGHVVRCLALATACDELGAKCTFLTRAPDPVLAEAIRTAGHALVELPERCDEASATVAALEERSARTLVLDSYELGREYLDAVHAASGATRVVIDDLADRELSCELVLNANPGAEGLEYSRWGAARLLLGPRYALVRGELSSRRRPARRLDPEVPQVLVTLGGSRVGTRAVDLARALDQLDRPLRIALLLGGRKVGADEARELARTARHAVDIHVGLSRVAELLARTTLAISAAGTTCFELAASGVPALLVVAAENQRRGAAAWAARGVFELLGDAQSVEPTRVAARASAALDDPEWLAERSRRGQELVDGDGAARAAVALVASVTPG